MADTATSDLLKDNLDDYYSGPEAEEIGDPDHSEAEETETGDQDDHGQDEESEADTDETEGEEGSEPSDYEVTIDGRSEKVTKAELIKGYQRQADYTRKTTSLAEDRKKYDAEKAGLEASLNTFKTIQADVEKLIMGDVSAINWDELRTSDPSEYLRMKEVVQGRQGELKRIIDTAQKLEAEQMPAKQLKLHKTMGWDHPEKGTQRRDADIKLIQEYHNGSPLLMSTDPDVLAALIESARYRKQQKAKAEIKPELKKAPKVTKSVKVNKPNGKSWLDDYYK